MDTGVRDYIRNMFSTIIPDWEESYEGVLLYDIENNVWVGGDNIGWIIFDEDV